MAMSRLLDLSDYDYGGGQSEADVEARKRLFAQEIHEDNVVEGLTFISTLHSSVNYVEPAARPVGTSTVTGKTTAHFVVASMFVFAVRLLIIVLRAARNITKKSELPH